VVSSSKLIPSTVASEGADKPCDKSKSCAAHVSMLSSASQTATFAVSSSLNPKWMLSVSESELNSPFQRSGHGGSSRIGVSLWMQLVERNEE
jgi:hypothetical protein